MLQSELNVTTEELERLGDAEGVVFNGLDRLNASFNRRQPSVTARAFREDGHKLLRVIGWAWQHPLEYFEETLSYPGGLKDYVVDLNAGSEALHDPITFRAEVDGVQVEGALQWTKEAYTDTLLGYANSIRTSDGGTHLDGLKTSLTRAVNTQARKAKLLKEADGNLGGEHIREGLSAVIAVWVPQPEF